jgi:amidase
MMDDLIFESATTLARLIQRKELSSAELVAACLAQIEAVNPRLNAVVQLAAATAMVKARAADAALARGEVIGPLHGVPMTIKDSFDTAGIISTWGTLGRKAFVPDEDATVVKRLKEAGAILLGKTNTPEFTYAHETDNLVYGRTNNPYDLTRTSGGSSGGAAAIVASGGSPFDIGSDSGGSIRNPAHFCGIAGIKPTSGRVPRTGHAVQPGGLLDWHTQVGPMARHVEDLALILPIIAGPDNRDPFVPPAPLGAPDRVKLKGLRGSFHTDNGIQSPTPEIVEAVQEAVSTLADAGVHFEEKRPPGIEETMDILPALYRGWDGGAMFRLMLERAGTAEEEASLTNFLEAKSATPEALVRLIDRWDQFRFRMLAFFEDHDLIVSPVNANPAISHGTFRELYRGFSYTMSYNLTGWPGAVVRVGSTAEGLPIGVQIVARPWREDVALAAAGYLESALGGWQKPSLVWD